MDFQMRPSNEIFNRSFFMPQPPQITASKVHAAENFISGIFHSSKALKPLIKSLDYRSVLKRFL